MRSLWLVPVLALTLTACGADPVADRRANVAAVIAAANDGDAAGLRDEVSRLRATIRAQVASGELDRAEGERLNAIALRVLELAGLLEQAPPPSPTPQEEEPEPTPTPEEEEPEPSPTPQEEEPEEEPPAEEEPEEEPTLEPAPETTIEIEPLPQESPPAPQSQGGRASPGPSPAT